MWVPYEQKRGYPHDFRVSYRFFPAVEGGRKTLPVQGYRCDFSYAGDDISQSGIYAIHPEFEDANGAVLLEAESCVPAQGTARMWVLFPAMRREVHARRITTGMQGFFMEGPRRVGAVQVIEMNGLLENAQKVID
ncbi:hypothetical protein [Saccharibacillus endophyticus]|uniref:PilZ domain-containing protein n=1 Tax=Saccharibacillus endophyticus TaxID=2060666 RepID=A0ABQ1ZW77_9BACL|nr:hypothetical protein [Saccharibacillus endophyticus]GGH79509.1 hypothetical protein GCM10007362_26410 [Saccharibacillus endophyticus]